MLCGKSIFADDQVFEPKEVPAPVERVFVPTGFDSNDNIEVVIYGKFPNSCYKVGHANYSIDILKNEIEISLTAYEYKSGFCIQLITPYLESVKIGVLPVGEYNIKIKDTEFEDTLMVAQSMVSSPDSFLYANISDVKLLNSQQHLVAGKQEIELEGEYPYTFHGCAVMERIEVIQIREDILEVLPIIKIINEGPLCKRESNFFKKRAQVDRDLIGTSLLHVRSASGSSLNRVVEGY